MNRLFALLLAVAPAPFRRRFGAEMKAVFRERCAEARHTGGRGAVLHLACRTVPDLVIQGLLLRFSGRSDPLRRRPTATGDGPMMQLLQDFTAAFRTLRRAPGFTLLAVITLGLGIGANTAIFSVVNGVLLRPLPYQQPQRLMAVWEQGIDGKTSNTGYATFVDWKKHSKAFSRLALLGYWAPSLSGHGTPERLEGQRVSQTFFSTLGVHPALGRDFAPEEDRPKANREAIITWGLFERRFGGDVAAVGKPFELNGATFTLIGVLPRDLESLFATGPSNPAEIFQPLGYDLSTPWGCRSCRHLRAIGRLAPGFTTAQATAELATIQNTLFRQFPNDYETGGIILNPLREDMLGDYSKPLWVLLGAVALVLAIACANVSSLVLARAQRRQGEMALRAALGASRHRLTRQLLAESVVLHLLGGVAGVLLAVVGIRLLIASSPPTILRLHSVAVDGRVLLVTFAVSLLCGLLFGLIPARLSGRQIRREMTAAAAKGASHHRLNGALVACDIALALVLVIGAGLLLESLTRLLNVDTGVDTHHVLAADITLSGKLYDSKTKIDAYYRRVLERVQALPGVEAVAVTSQLPLGGNFDGDGIRFADHPNVTAAEVPTALRYSVSADYLAAVRIPLLHGRAFDRTDTQTSAPVALVNATFVHQQWPGVDPIGKRIKVGDPDGPWRTIVGVVGDVRHVSLAAVPPLEVYTPESQWSDDSDMVLVVRAANPAALADPVRRAIWEIDADRPLTRVAAMDDIVGATLSRHLLTLRLLTVFAAIALLLAMVGIYGVLSYSVSERTREIGVRMALGAVPARIFRLILQAGAIQVGAGLAAGLVLALATTRLLQGLLYEVRPQDPATFAGLALVVAVVAAVAGYLPARRAMAVNPIQAIKAG